MRILIVEDHQEVLEDVCDHFRQCGYHVTTARDGLTGLHLAATEGFDLAILNIALPGIDGYQVCRRIRESSVREMAVILVAPSDELAERLEGFRAGADDCLVKPLVLRELQARAEAIMRRRNGAGARLLRVADLAYDMDALEVTRAGERLKLTQTNLKILELLMRRSPTVVSRRELEVHAWGEASGDTESLRSNIHFLRRAIDRPFTAELLHTVHGIGYQLVLRGN